MNLHKYFLLVFFNVFIISYNCMAMKSSKLPGISSIDNHINMNLSDFPKLTKYTKEKKSWAPIRHGVKSNVHVERQKNDFYATDPHSVELFLNKIKEDGIVLPKIIHEPACGQGHISKKLEKHGYTVISSDLNDYKYGTSGIDFLTSNETADCFFTNPPFKLALKFIKKSIDNLNPGGKSIMYLKLSYLSGQKRGEFFKLNPPKYVYVHSSRQACARNGNFEQFKDKKLIDYAWYIWEKGFNGETTLRWIP